MAEKGIQRSSRRSTIPGVAPIRKDGLVVGYQARTILPSKQLLTKYFSVRSYGAASALAMAISERRQQLKDAGVDQPSNQAARARPKKVSDRVSRLLKEVPLDVALEAMVAADLLAEHGPDLVGIKREDITNAEGWSVSYGLGRSSSRQYFLDARYGGAEASFYAAFNYRNALRDDRKRRPRRGVDGRFW